MKNQTDLSTCVFNHLSIFSCGLAYFYGHFKTALPDAAAVWVPDLPSNFMRKYQVIFKGSYHSLASFLQHGS